MRISDWSNGVVSCCFDAKVSARCCASKVFLEFLVKLNSDLDARSVCHDFVLKVLSHLPPIVNEAIDKSNFPIIGQLVEALNLGTSRDSGSVDFELVDAVFRVVQLLFERITSLEFGRFDNYHTVSLNLIRCNVSIVMIMGS